MNSHRNIYGARETRDSSSIIWEYAAENPNAPGKADLNSGVTYGRRDSY